AHGGEGRALLSRTRARTRVDGSRSPFAEELYCRRRDAAGPEHLGRVVRLAARGDRRLASVEADRTSEMQTLIAGKHSCAVRLDRRRIRRTGPMTSNDRRQFLKATITSAAGLAASPVLAAQTTGSPSPAQKAVPTLDARDANRISILSYSFLGQFKAGKI